MTQIHPKVAASGASGAVVVVLSYLLTLLGVDLPAEVEASLVVLISFAAGYVKSA